MELFVGLFKHHLFAAMGHSVVIWSLLLVRVLGFLHFAPVFSNKSVPSHCRIGMAILLTLMLSPKAFAQTIPDAGYSLLFSVLANFALGFVMGFTANILFTIVMAGGEMMDAAMGFSSAQMFDPSIGSQTTIFGKFMSTLCIIIFFQISGPEMLIEGLSHSLETFSIYDPNIKINIFKIIHSTGDIISMGFILVSPIVLTILINDIILGLLSRAAPQLNAFQISFTIKPLIGLLIFLLILPTFFMSVSNLLAGAGKMF